MFTGSAGANLRIALGFTGILISITTCFERTSRAQVVNPADKQSDPATQQGASQAADQVPVHTWQLPSIDVYGKAPLTEEDRVGKYAQPRWTAHRRFGETRV